MIFIIRELALDVNYIYVIPRFCFFVWLGFYRDKWKRSNGLDQTNKNLEEVIVFWTLPFTISLFPPWKISFFLFIYLFFHLHFIILYCCDVISFYIYFIKRRRLSTDWYSMWFLCQMLAQQVTGIKKWRFYLIKFKTYIIIVFCWLSLVSFFIYFIKQW